MKKRILVTVLALVMCFGNCISAYSEEETVSEKSLITVETNEIQNWPAGPTLNARAAFLVEANTGVVLYAKNIHEHLYPASTTKMITALLAAENCQMDETVKFSHDAVFSLEPGSSNIGIDPGQAMPMEECLYGLMVGSANEVANAVAEHVGGDMDSFVQMMNDKVESLGLKDTHFTNANGLHDEEHYTSAFDLAMIANEFFHNEYLAKIGNTATYHFEATASQPDDFYVKNKHKLISGEIPYTGIKGGKTGYTDAAGETLVTCAEQNGMMLICVILDEESPDQFYDTVKLFDYGFSNFEIANIAENETQYSIKSNNFFPSDVDILGTSGQIIELCEDNYVILPKNITFDDMETNLSYQTQSADDIAYIEYSYHGAYLGYGTLKAVENKVELSAFEVEGAINEKEEEIEEEDNITFVNVVNIAYWILIVAGALIVIAQIQSVIVNYNVFENIKQKRSDRSRRRRNRGSLKF